MMSLTLPVRDAAARPFPPGYYEGETSERCPPVAVEKGICRELFKLPVSFTLTATRITDIRVMEMQHCEGGLPPRITIVEVHKSFPLRRDWGPRAGSRMTFDSQPRSNGLGKNGVLGTVWPGGRVNGYISTVSKVADDTYCVGGARWQAGPHSLPTNPNRWLTIPPPPGEPTLEPGLRERCMATALKRPPVKDPLRMVHAGIWPNTGFRYEQAAVGSFTYEEMPEACAARYGRASHADLQMLKRGHWVTTRIWVAGASNRGGTSRVSTYGGHPDIPARIPEYNTCDGGHRFHKMRIRVTSRLTRPALRKSEGSRSWAYPVAVEGSCGAATTSGRRVHKLQHELFGTPLRWDL